MMTAPVEPKPRVLFVDDEPTVTAALRTALRRSPYEVHIASSGADALRILDQTSIDVVVSDLDMPDMGGRELLARIRTAHPKAVRVVLSGNPRLDETIRIINDTGVFRFLVKPCTPHDLGQCLDDAVAARRAHPTTTPPPSDADDVFAEAVASLWMAAQPIVSWKERRVVAYETLVRTRSPQVPHAGAFIELAEQTGKVRELERTIRRAASHVADALPDGALLLVNLHPSALDDPELVSENSPSRRHPVASRSRSPSAPDSSPRARRGRPSGRFARAGIASRSTISGRATRASRASSRCSPTSSSSTWS